MAACPATMIACASHTILPATSAQPTSRRVLHQPHLPAPVFVRCICLIAGSTAKDLALLHTNVIPPPQSHPPTPVPPRTEYIDSCDMVAGPPVSYLPASKGEGRGERGEGRGLGDWATRRSRYHSIYVAWRQKVRRKNFPMQIALEQVSLATRSADSARLSQDLRPT